jgi:hypothetical protein
MLFGDTFLIFVINKDIDMDIQQQPQVQNEKDNDKELPNPEFSFKYTESGGITRRYLLISYNSKTNTITSSTDVSGSNITEKKPTESDEQELKEVVRETDFFKTRTDYPPEKEDESLVAYTLTITVGSNAHTTGWTDVSKDMPDSIIKIVNEIKRIVSKEKIV